MITSHCPRCSETFRLPAADLPLDAMAQCPWCGETYSVAEIVAQLPPLVQLKSADGFPLYLERSVSEQTPQNNDFEETDDLGQFEELDADFDEQDAEQDLQVADSPIINPESDFRPSGVAAPMRVNARPRPKTKSSPIKGILGTFAGLLLAIPLAGGILLAIGKAPDLGIWPFVGSDLDSTRSAAPANRSTAAANRRSSSSSDKWSRPKHSAKGSANGLGSDLQGVNRKLGAEMANAETPQSPSDGPMAKPSDYLSVVPSDTNASADSGQVSYPVGEQDLAAEPKRPGETPENLPELKGETSGMPLPESYDESYNPDDVASQLESFAMGRGDGTPATAKSKPTSQSDEPVLDKPLLDEPVEQPIAEPPTVEIPTVELSLPSVPALREPILENTDSTPNDGAGVDTQATVVEVPEPETDAAVEAAVTNANRHLTRLMQYDGEESGRTRLFAVAYEAVAIVAAEPGAGKNKRVDRLLANLIRSPLVDDLGNAANTWLDYPKRKTNGAIFVGQVSTESNKTVMKINTSAGGQRSVHVSGTDLPPSGRILALGIIEDSVDDKNVEIVAFKNL